MHPRRAAQDVLRCDLCKTDPLLSRCKLCNINLCVNCVGRHLSDSSKDHNVVPFLQRSSTPSYPKCGTHARKQCELYCEKCDIPVCSTCVTSGKHEGHKLSDVLEKLSFKTEKLQKDLEELETRIYPRYKEMASDVQTEKAELGTNYGKLIKAADQHGENLHREITAIVNQRKFDIAEMKSKHLAALNENTDEITNRITELRQIIQDLKKILNSNDVSLTSTYKSRNSEFRSLPPKVRVTLPSFSPQKINKDHLNEMCGSLSSLFIKKEQGETMKSAEAASSPPVKPMKSPEAVSSPPVKPMKSPEAVSSPPVKPMKSPEAVSSPPVKPLLDDPRFTATTDTGYNRLSSVSCLCEDQVWTCGNSNIIKLLTVQGKLLSSVQTKSGKEPNDITVTRGGDLVYTDDTDRTINVVNNEQTLTIIRTVITLQGWRPGYVCCTASGDLLVTMDSDDGEQSKVVRYSGSTETQTIQFDDQGRPLYSSGYGDKYISENQNLDICVADNRAEAVVVVNQSGALRFRYTGHPSDTGVYVSFNPAGIATDSQSHILIADFGINGRIHILDQDGQFLRYIHNLRRPQGLCVDSRDNLFVAEWGTAKVKKIQYQ